MVNDLWTCCASERGSREEGVDRSAGREPVGRVVRATYYGPQMIQVVTGGVSRLEFRHSDRHLRSVMIENFLLWPREG